MCWWERKILGLLPEGRREAKRCQCFTNIYVHRQNSKSQLFKTHTHTHTLCMASKVEGGEGHASNRQLFWSWRKANIMTAHKTQTHIHLFSFQNMNDLHTALPLNTRPASNRHAFGFHASSIYTCKAWFKALNACLNNPSVLCVRERE